MTNMPLEITLAPNSTKPPVVQLKNGKIVFKQKSMAMEKLSDTMQETVRFRELLINNQQPLTIIRDEDLPLIAKLVHESDKTLTGLTKFIRQQLLPESFVDGNNETFPPTHDILPLSIVENAIQSVAERVNYGVEPNQLGNAASKVPAALCMWRWEVKDHASFPKQIRDKIESRRLERVAAKKELVIILDALTADQKLVLAGNKVTGTNNLATTIQRHPSTDCPLEIGKENIVVATQPIELAELSKDIPKESLKSVRSEKQAKEEESTKKSAAVMAKFFTKKASKPAGTGSMAKESCSVVVVDKRNDFDRTFFPFVVRKNVHLAPQNWFLRRQKEVVVLDVDEQMPADQNACPRDLLRMALADMPSGVTSIRRSTLLRGLRVQTSPSVRRIHADIIDAEERGDEQAVIRLLRTLRNRKLVPLKVFSFHEDVRPGYTGTWTRLSATVGPRTPMARDLEAFDYACDSGEEWEEEEEGEEVMSVGEPEDEPLSDEDSLDGWLVGDDEDVGGELLDLEPDMDVHQLHNKKRKKSPVEEDQAKSRDKKRKVVLPLLPFIKGPSWECEVGKCEWAGFRPYRVQFFDDVTFPIDPFTFMSEIPNLHSFGYKTIKEPVVAATDKVEFVAPLPVDRYAIHPETSSIDQKKKPPAPPKMPFPEVHIPALLDGIRTCKTASFNVLVDTLYQNLKDLKVKKNSIEFKLKEVAEKRSDKTSGTKIWMVKLDPAAAAA